MLRINKLWSDISVCSDTWNRASKARILCTCPGYVLAILVRTSLSVLSILSLSGEDIQTTWSEQSLRWSENKIFHVLNQAYFWRLFFCLRQAAPCWLRMAMTEPLPAQPLRTMFLQTPRFKKGVYVALLCIKTHYATLKQLYVPLMCGFSWGA